MPLQLFLVRHPETINNKVGIIEGPMEGGLSDYGKSQISDTVDKLISLKITKAYSSDSARCKDLAETFSKRSGISINYDMALREINSGEWIGMKKTEVKKLIAQNKQPKDGEHLPELMERAKLIIQKVKSENGNILLISHACLIKMIVGITKGMDSFKSDKEIHVKNCEIVELKIK